jgi:CRISPR-associated protein Csb2
MKTVRPTRFRDGDTGSSVLVLGHDVSPDVARHVETIAAIARHVIALGWGIDVVSARADVLAEREIEALPGERWQDGPARSGGHRVPVTGTLEALEARHRGFLARVQGSVWRAPPALTRYRLVSYRRATDPISRPYAAFAIRDAAASERFRAFDTARETVVVAGRLRDATHRAALAAKAGQWPPTEIARFVLGHAEARGAAHEAAGPRRFAYLPVPTLHARGPGDESAGAIRRVLLTSFADDCDGEIAWAASALAGVELLDEETREPVALLEALSGDDAACARCAPPRGASVWTSVTPVILPGHDDRKRLRARREDEGDAMARRRAVLRRDARTDALLRKAIVQAGIDETLAAHAAITWQGPGLLAGVAHASTYRVPHHLARSPRLHVRIAWRTPGGEPLVMPGPLCIGSGRFYGLGLLVAER